MDESKHESRSLFYLLLSAFAFLSGWLLSRSRPPYEDSSETVSAHNIPDKESGERQIQSAGISQIAPCPPQQNQSNRRKDDTPLWKETAEWSMTGATIGLLVVNIFLMESTKRAADAAEKAANWTQRQTQYLFDEQRPFVWVKMLDGFHVEVGRPITAKVEVFNYGHTPATVRAYGYIESGPMVIEKLRDHPLGNAPESKGIRIILLAPGESTEDFPIETQGKVLTEEDLRLITNGGADVVIYGHIDYTNPHNPGLQVAKFMSSFCFYRLKDGAVSVCPNFEPHGNIGFTNWTP